MILHIFLNIKGFTFLIPKFLWIIICKLTKYDIYLYRINLRLKYLKETDFKLEKLFYGYYSCVYIGFIILILQLIYTDKLLDNRFINFGFDQEEKFFSVEDITRR